MKALNREIVTKNLFWRLAERIGAQGVNFIVAIVLARILTPDDYGLVSLVMVLIAIMQVFVDSGLGNALIQKKEADETDFSTVFFFNIAICLLLYFLLFLTGPYIALFFHHEQLTPITRVLGLIIIISGVKNVQQAYISKNMLFKKFFFATLGGTLFSAVVGIVMAVRGYGVWALVTQQIMNAFVDTVILWATVRWRPVFQISFERFQGLFSFGWKLLLSSLLDTIYNNIRTLTIGKLYSPADLAYYNKANQFPSFIVTNANAAIDSVLFPTMASAQENKEHVRSMLRRSIKVTGFAVWPMMIGLAVIAPALVKVLLTEKWIQTVPYIRVFCIYYAFWPIHTANLNAIKAVGRSDVFLKLEVIKKIVGMAALVASLWYGPFAIAAAMTLTAPVSAVINAYPNRNLFEYGIRDQFSDVFSSVVAALLMGAAMAAVSLLSVSSFTELLLQLIVGTVTYMLISSRFNQEVFGYVVRLAKGIGKGSRI